MKRSNSLNGHNPDILTCLANLSADEVFTPPKLANAMLDILPQELFASPETTFLDPVCKSGVFLREIARRLNEKLKDRIPDEQARVDHILTKQVFGLAITELTSLISRRSLYCSKTANSKYSIATQLDRPDGNVRLPKSKHKWDDTKCIYCGAPKTIFDRDSSSEEYAYPLIHGVDPNKEFNMRFDVIVGNPPYQLRGGAGGSSDSSIYHKFVEQGFLLEPRFAVFVTPSRWMAGGRGLDEFRSKMLTSGNIRELVDFPDASDAFPGVQIKGGVCYFLWDRDHPGTCNVTRIASGETHEQPNRNLGEFDVFIRDDRAVTILRKVLSREEPSMIDLISGDTPFGIATNFTDYTESKQRGKIALHLIASSRRTIGYLDASLVRKNVDLINEWKVLVPEAYGAGETYPHQILGKEIVAPPPSVCTQSYLAVSPFESDEAANSFASYYRTRFFRFLVSLRKITQHALRSTYTWVPQQSWDKSWNDELLYKKYKITKDEIVFIESIVRAMD
jgi:site-specific DNA-methyltransferase (adenine-specific)